MADGSPADLQAMASDNVVTIFTWPGTLGAGPAGPEQLQRGNFALS